MKANTVIIESGMESDLFYLLGNNIIPFSIHTLCSCNLINLFSRTLIENGVVDIYQGKELLITLRRGDVFGMQIIFLFHM